MYQPSDSKKEYRLIAAYDPKDCITSAWQRHMGKLVNQRWLLIRRMYLRVLLKSIHMQTQKTVVITGASSGIGFDACRYLLDKGFRVFGTVRKPEDKERLEAHFTGDFEALLLDLRSDESISSLTRTLSEKLSSEGLYGLINNAGIALGGPLLFVDDHVVAEHLETNLNAVFKLTNRLLPLMGASFQSSYQPGRIINISSVSGRINTPMLGPYCISKHALESMSDVYRRELGVYGIRVILLQPGPIQTPIWKKSVPGENPLTNTDYGAMYESFRERVKRSEEGALPVERVSSQIFRALTAKRPKSRILIARNPLAIKLIHHCLPDAWLDKLFIGQMKKVMNSTKNTLHTG